MTTRGTATRTRVWAATATLALALLTSCVNPLFFDQVQADVNHAPVLINMQPQPSFEPRPINVGDNCAPLDTFRPDRIDDADLDVLLVRWSLVFESDQGTPQRVKVLDLDLVPLEEPVDGAFYAFEPFQLTYGKLFDALKSDLLIKTIANEPSQQLLELRVTDNGFKTGTDEAPDPGGVVYQSWLIDLIDEACE